MPSVSKRQHGFMGAAMKRKEEGKSLPTDPKMSNSQFKDFTSTKTKNLPARASKHKVKIKPSFFSK